MKQACSSVVQAFACLKNQLNKKPTTKQDLFSEPSTTSKDQPYLRVVSKKTAQNFSRHLHITWHLIPFMPQAQRYTCPKCDPLHHFSIGFLQSHMAIVKENQSCKELVTFSPTNFSSEITLSSFSTHSTA